MAIYFADTFFQKFREAPLALQAVRALVIDMKKEMPIIGIIYKSCDKKQGRFN